MSWLARFGPPFALLGLLLLLFAPVLLDGRLLAIGDGLAQDFPLRILAARAWHQGIVPFWNPFGFGGLPLLATIHVGVFFPGNLPFLFLPPVAAMNLTVILALWSGGLGAYALARAQGLGRLAAFTSGCVFMGSGFMIAHIENLQMLQAAALMPAVLWAIARHAEAGGSRYARAFAVVLALQILAGHPQMVVFTGLVAGAYTLWLLRGRVAGTRQAFLLPLLAGGVLGLGLSLLQLLPTLAFIPQTQRAVIGYDALVFRSLPPRQAITFWIPYFFGGHNTALFPLSYWGQPHQTELTGYAGLVSLVLGVLALLTPGLRTRAAFWAGVAVLGGLLALGEWTPLYDLWARVPLLKSLPAPGRHLLETDLAIALLAGFGMQALADARRRHALLAWLLAGLPLVAVAAVIGFNGEGLEQRLQPFMPPDFSLDGAFSLARPVFWVPLALWAACGAIFASGRGRGRGLQVAALGLLVLDLGLFAANQRWVLSSPQVPTPLMPPAPELVADEARILPLSSAFVYPYHDLASIQALRYPNWGCLADVRSCTGYDAFVPVRYASLMGWMQSTGVVPSWTLWYDYHHGLDLLAVGTVLADPELGRWPELRRHLPAPRFRELPREPGAVRFANERALPRAWRLERVESVPSWLVDRHVTRDAAFQPGRVGYLDAPDAAAGSWSPGTASARAKDFNTIQLQTDGAGPGFVAVSESFDPGWRAFSNGRELPLHRLDGLILGVEVPAGLQHVVLRYEPRGWRPGLAGSLLSLLLLLLWRLRRRPA